VEAVAACLPAKVLVKRFAMFHGSRAPFQSFDLIFNFPRSHQFRVYLALRLNLWCPDHLLEVGGN
jgi:hypothetical protein